jgi:hypothetical protein
LGKFYNFELRNLQNGAWCQKIKTHLFLTIAEIFAQRNKKNNIKCRIIDTSQPPSGVAVELNPALIMKLYKRLQKNKINKFEIRHDIME